MDSSHVGKLERSPHDRPVSHRSKEPISLLDLKTTAQPSPSPSSEIISH